MKVVAPSVVRELDRRTIAAGTPGLVLMERAAAAVAREVMNAILRRPSRGMRVVVVAGTGNNGGDGFEIARLLARLPARWHVEAVLVGDPANVRGEARLTYQRLLQSEVRVVRARSRTDLESVHAASLVVDALFGTGLSRPIEAGSLEAQTLDAIAGSRAFVVAVDVPSGLDAGRVTPIGPHVTADVTVTFGHPKPALVGLPSAAACGRVVVADIGLVPLLAEDDGPAPEVLVARDVASLFPRRESEAHKGDFGRLGLLAGSPGMSGAAVLSARAALASGAGLVTVLSEESVRAAVHTLLAEAMSAPAETGFTGFAALAVGPGLGASEEARANVRRALVSQLPSVFDADALNAHAGAPEGFRRTPETVLTPHPGEAARLLSTTAAAVNRDREAAALELSRRSSAVVILKGFRSLVASPAGRVVKLLAGNPSMAKGGSGDVLTGIVGALLARGFSAWDAATAGALLHGLAGDLAREASHEESVVASDLVQALPEAFHAVNESGRSPSDPLATSPAPPPA